MKYRPEISGELQLHSIPIFIERVGHVDPMRCGTFVELLHKQATVKLYADFDDRAGGLAICEAGVGVVFDHVWHVDPLELRSAQAVEHVHSQSYGHLKLKNVYEFLWYRVRFNRGTFLARYNWLTEGVTAPVEQKVSP